MSTKSGEVQIDSLGDTLWTRKYGGPHNDAGNCVLETASGDYVIAGRTYSSSSSGYDVYLAKTGPEGDIVWNRKYGGPHDDEGYCVIETGDKGLVVVGSYGYAGYGDNTSDIYLIRTDSMGDTMWTHAFGTNREDQGRSIARTSGGYVIAGYTENTYSGEEDVYLVKTDSLGNMLWSFHSGGTMYDYGNSVISTEDGDVIVAGLTSTVGWRKGTYASGAEVYILKVDKSGSPMWAKGFSEGREIDEGRCVLQTTDGALVIVGKRDEWGSESSIYLLKCTEKGLLFR